MNVPSPVGQSYGINLCHDEYCCTFNYGFETPSPQELSFNYAAVVYHGTRKHLCQTSSTNRSIKCSLFTGQMDGSGYGTMVCAVIACQAQDISTCGVRNETFSFDREWHTLYITSEFPADDHSLYFPTTLDSSIMPFKVNQIAMTTTLY